MGILPAGYCVVVAIKATFKFPGPGTRTPDLADEQIELYESDSFLGMPGYSSPLYENDFAPFKPRCDVLIHAMAHAPGSEPVTQLGVAAEIAGMNKRFDVTGRRLWQKQDDTIVLSQPEPFTEQALSWEIAYGGIDATGPEAPEKVETYVENPVGAGFWKTPQPELLENTAVAQTLAEGAKISSPTETHVPQGFGPIGRNWPPRTQYAGTYDRDWEKTRKPFLPADFDPLYYQCAPVDQQIDHLRGGEPVRLTNLTAEGETFFFLPILRPPLVVEMRNGEKNTPQLAIDTLTINAEKRHFTLVARTHVPFIHSIQEIQKIRVGEKSHQPEAVEEPEENDMEPGEMELSEAELPGAENT
jgi:hypothetical protein